MNIKIYVAIIVVTILSSCATTRTYHLITGARLTTPSGNNNNGSYLGSAGGMFGFTEQTGNLVATITAFYSKYNSSTHGLGVDATLSYDTGIFRPGIGYDYTWVNTSSNIFSIGPSLALDFPLSKSMSIVTQGDYRFPLKGGAHSKNIIGQVGIRFGGWDVK